MIITCQNNDAIIKETFVNYEKFLDMAHKFQKAIPYALKKFRYGS